MEDWGWSGWFDSWSCCGNDYGNMNALYRSNCQVLADFEGSASQRYEKALCNPIRVYVKRFCKYTRCKIYLVLRNCSTRSLLRWTRGVFTGIPSMYDNRENHKGLIQKEVVPVKPLSHLMSRAAHDDPANAWRGPASRLPQCCSPALSCLLHSSHKGVIWHAFVIETGYTKGRWLHSLNLEKCFEFLDIGEILKKSGLVTAVIASVCFGAVRRCVKGTKRLSSVIILFQKVCVREHLK